MLMFIIGLLSGSIIISILFLIFRKKKNTNCEIESKYLRRGIYDAKYTFGDTSVFAQIEIGEIEKTTTRSKIESINISISGVPAYQSHNDVLNKIKLLVKNRWVESDEIEWIPDNISLKRDEKIENILSK